MSDILRSDLLVELGQLGSVDALVAAHPELNRDDVIVLLDEAAHLVAENVSGYEAVSPLYRAYNGYMLGLFTAGSQFFEAREERERQEAVVHRITDFLMELTSGFETKVDIRRHGGDIESSVDGVVRELDPGLADFYQLGHAAFRFVFTRVSGQVENEAKDNVIELLSHLGYHPILFRRAFESRPLGIETTLTWQALVSDCIRLLRDVLVEIEPEQDTCFVAMPFLPVYEGRYLDFYRRVADFLDMRCIRAWGDLGQEEHQELLFSLLSKCGAILADVTKPNASVAIEIGYSLGKGKDILLLANIDEWERAANIQLDWVHQYDTSEDEWEYTEARNAAIYLQAVTSLRQPGDTPVWSAKPIEAMGRLAEILELEEDVPPAK